ncbi:hypothetical protein MRB53_025786 [Persea americana]|uniref:Uncharacterized protein n=1 Tax=Persea americana TaxID=3435 RepID=A0ACC2LGT3_PERAE|nr:hypothetical protein MRB53_025786 [Persea americana]
MKKYSPTTLSAQYLLLFLLSYQQNLSTASENAQSKSYIVYMGERKHSDPSLVVDSHHTILLQCWEGANKKQLIRSFIVTSMVSQDLPRG